LPANTVLGKKHFPIAACFAIHKKTPKVASDEDNLGGSLLMMVIKVVAVGVDYEDLGDPVGMVTQAMEAEEGQVLVARALLLSLKVMGT
jgi:hypothetical protein